MSRFYRVLDLRFVGFIGFIEVRVYRVLGLGFRVMSKMGAFGSRGPWKEGVGT